MQCCGQIPNPKPNPNSFTEQRKMPPSSSGRCFRSLLQFQLGLVLLLLLAFPVRGLDDGDETDTIASDLQACENLSANKKTVINYPSLHSCVFGSIYAISIPFMLVMVILAFYILAKTAQDHFSPVVSKMVDMLHLSPSTGGVTLLALGNGAPDVFSSVAAVWGGNPRIGLGAIVSAGMFVSALVVGFVALAASPFPLNPVPFVRDVCFYLFGAMLMFLLYLSGEVHFWQAAGLVSVYVIFVVVVFVMDQGRGKSKALNSSLSDLNTGSCNQEEFDVLKNVSSSCSSHGCLDVESGDCEPEAAKTNGISKEISGKAYQDKQPKDLARVFTTLIGSVLPCGNDTSKFSQVMKVQLIWQVPVEIILRSTIPVVIPSQWNRFYASANLIFCPLIFLYIISSAVSPYKKMVFIIPWIDFPLWGLVLVQGSILAVAYFILTKEPPKEEAPIAVVTAFIMSVFWISFIAGELVGCLATLGVLLKLPPALLGLTVLAWGNSIGDLVADVAVAKAGQPAMAMAGCFAGPMFNMLVGFGLALAVKTSRMHPSPYLLEYNPSIVIAFFFLFTGLLGSLSVIMFSKFQVPRFWGYWLIGLYITFIVISISNAGML